MSFVLTPVTIALCACASISAYFLVKKMFEKDKELENRHRAAAKLAAKLQEVGLRRLPEFLIDYSVGDYAGMAHKIHLTSELFLNDASLYWPRLTPFSEMCWTPNLPPRKVVRLLRRNWQSLPRLRHPWRLCNAKSLAGHSAGIGGL